MNFTVAAREARVTMKQYRSSPRIIAKTLIEAAEKYDLDGVFVEIDTVTLAHAVGVPVDFPEDAPARSHLPSLKSLEQVNDLPPADVADDDCIQIWTEACRLVKDYFKDEKFIQGSCDQAPFSLASMMRTPQMWLMDLLDHANRTNVFHLLNYCCDACEQFVEMIAQAGVDMISNGDSPAGPDLISPDMYAEFAWPYEKKLADKAHQLGKYYMLHICGNTDVILERMVRLGADAIELDYKTDLRKIHALCKDSVTFSGNLDPTGVMRNGTVSQVKEKATELLGIYSDSPRLIVNAGCLLPADTPSENIKMLVETAHQELLC